MLTLLIYRQTLENALETYCGFSATHFFVYAIEDDGTSKIYTNGGHILGGDVIRQFFNPEVCNQVMDGKLDECTRMKYKSTMNK